MYMEYVINSLLQFKKRFWSGLHISVLVIFFPLHSLSLSLSWLFLSKSSAQLFVYIYTYKYIYNTCRHIRNWLTSLKVNMILLQSLFFTFCIFHGNAGLFKLIRQSDLPYTSTRMHVLFLFLPNFPSFFLYNKRVENLSIWPKNALIKC